MRVLHVIPSVSPVYGGPSYAIRSMVTSLAKIGLEVDVATTTANGREELDIPLNTPLAENGVRYFYFPRQFPKNWTFSRPLAQWLYRHAKDYDVIHIHALFSYPTLPACRSAQLAGVPYVIRPLGTLSPRSLAHKPWRKVFYYHLFEKRNLVHAVAIHATSRLEAESLECLGLGREIHVIPLGVDLVISPSPPKRPNSPLRILFLSRLHPMKGLPLLFQALALLRREGLRPFLTVAGEGDAAYPRKLKQAMETLGLESQIEFIGFVQGEDKTRVLADADIFVLPSHQENFGVAAAEAMAAGLPVIVSDQVGIAPDIQEYGAGLVVQCGADSIKEGLKKLMGDPVLRSEMGRQGQRLVRERFSWEKVASQLIELYEGILAGKA